MNSPPTNPYSHSSSLVGRDNDDGNEFYINDNVGGALSSPSTMRLPSFNGLPPPSPSSLRGTIGTTTDNAHGEQTLDGGTSSATTPSTSLVSRIMNGNCCSIQSLRPFFQIDTVDIIIRIKSTIKYIMINDGFRNNVLYSDIDAVSDLALSISSSSNNNNSNNNNNDDGNDNTTTTARNNPPSTGGFGGSDDEIESYDRARTATSCVSVPSIRLGRMVVGGKGPDLYGPIWITLTLVFCAAVTSNMSLYLHHSRTNRLFAKSMIDEGGIAAEEEWDYDINKLLHAMWILYGYSFGLPTVVYCAMGMIGNNNSLVELICLYGYSLVPYLLVVWVCIIPINSIQWTILFLATIVSGMFILRNVISSIMRNGGNNAGYGSSSSSGVSSLQRSSGGGLIMCLVACHFVFFLILKLTFYHHVGLPKK